MNRILPAVLAVLALAGCVSAEEPLPLPFTEGWVAKVNGDPILASDVITKMGDRIAGLRNSHPRREDFARELELLFDQTLYRLALDRVVQQKAKRMNIQVSDDEVETEVKEEIKREADGNREKFVEQIAQKGFSMSSYKDVLKSQMLGERILGGNIDHTATFVRPEEVFAFFKDHPELFTRQERVRPRVLRIVARGPGAADKALRYAEGLKRQVEAGADFAGLVKWSEGDVEREAPVDLEWRERGDLDPVLVQPVFDAEVGAIVGPVQGETGVYLVKVEGHEASTTVSFETAQSAISSEIRREKVRIEIARADHQLLKEAVVEFRVERCRHWYEDQAEDGAGR
ncbi:MAG: peptidyl-prolyl cis-trans isomerase [Planctomycetes bacterium]|nr:peptidyl-prolyl cis-trans isomerase [Planctomycetota bacterium]